jgi:hypothetical protein
MIRCLTKKGVGNMKGGVSGGSTISSMAGRSLGRGTTYSSFLSITTVWDIPDNDDVYLKRLQREVLIIYSLYAYL